MSESYYDLIDRLIPIMIFAAGLIFQKILQWTNQWHSEKITRFNSRTQLSTAALERRLEVHQNGFLMWIKLRKHLNGNEEGRNKVEGEFNNWLEENIIYLTANSRASLIDAATAFKTYRPAQQNLGDELQTWHQNDPDRNEMPIEVQHATDLLKEKVAVLYKAGNVIVEEMTLPGLPIPKEYLEPDFDKYISSAQEGEALPQ